MVDIKSAKTINYANVGFLLAACAGLSLSAALALVTQWLQAGTRGPMLVSDIWLTCCQSELWIQSGD